LLNERQLVDYLLDRGLVGAADVVAGDLAVQDLSRRNHNLAVLRGREPSYLVKQDRGQQGPATIAREAAFYQRVHGARAFAPLARYLPGYYGYDVRTGVLVLEFLPSARSLREYHHARRRFPTTPATRLGSTLGLLHRLTTTGRVDLGNGAIDVSSPPWILSLHRSTVGMFQQMSGAHPQLVSAVQRHPRLVACLDDLRRDWTASSAVHGDLKWDNVLLVPGSAARRRTELKLIDWEMVSVGDPCWDVGSVFNDYLAAWVLSMPIADSATLEQLAKLARYPLEAMQPAIRAFWQAYLGQSLPRGGTSDDRLLRSVRYAGARLLQTAYEVLQTSHQLTPHAVCLAQLSLNVMEQPDEAAKQLLGLARRQEMAA
jgi:hypothetical protein